jgi:hypothetical protein
MAAPTAADRIPTNGGDLRWGKRLQSGMACWRLGLGVAGRMGAHRRGYPRRCSRAAWSRHRQVRQRAEEADEVAGEQRGVDAKLTAVMA